MIAPPRDVSKKFTLPACVTIPSNIPLVSMILREMTQSEIHRGLAVQLSGVTDDLLFRDIARNQCGFGVLRAVTSARVGHYSTVLVWALACGGGVGGTT